MSSVEPDVKIRRKCAACAFWPMDSTYAFSIAAVEYGPGMTIVRIQQRLSD